MITLKNYGKNIASFVQYLSRDDSSDDFVMNETDYDNCNFTATDRWLDVGAYIGDFALKNYRKVNEIICIEPVRENYLMLYANMALNAVYNFQHYPYLVMAERMDEAPIYLNAKANQAKHSPFRPRYGNATMVKTVKLDFLIKKFNVNKIKMDIEGGELEILKKSRRLKEMQELIFEYHYDDDIDQSLKQLSQLKFYLRDIGFRNVDCVAEDMQAKTQVIHCTKNKI